MKRCKKIFENVDIFCVNLEKGFMCILDIFSWGSLFIQILYFSKLPGNIQKVGLKKTAPNPFVLGFIVLRLCWIFIAFKLDAVYFNSFLSSLGPIYSNFSSTNSVLRSKILTPFFWINVIRNNSRFCFVISYFIFRKT